MRKMIARRGIGTIFFHGVEAKKVDVPTAVGYLFTDSLRQALRLMAAASLAILVSGTLPALTQNNSVKSFVGTVMAFKPEAGDLEIKPDNAPLVLLKLSEKALALRVAPGEKDLKKAEAIKITDLAVGDRVLVTLDPSTTDVRRVIVMSSTDIAKRNEMDRQDWAKRGISGIVAAKNGSQITVSIRSIQGPVPATVTVDERTSFKRYAPDSVKFEDAKPSTLDEISVGDQLRARGQKSEDGLKVVAGEVVFGTFVTKAGSVTSVNTQANEITVKELGTGKSLIIKLTADSQLKKMPNFGGMMPGGSPPGFSSGGENRSAGGSSAAGVPRTGVGGPSGSRDLSQMLERMPAATIDELKPGETIVVSSTKGAQIDQITAIMLVANADMLIRMASQQSGGGRAGEANNRGMNGGMMGLTDVFGGFELPGMIR
jgi:hypothetical protein